MSNLQGAYTWAVNMCNRSMTAYDQSYRNMQVRPSDQRTCFDCSSFTFFALWLGGQFDVGSLGYSTTLSDYTSIPNTANAWTVSSFEAVAAQLGFTMYNVGSVAPQAGDIVTKISTHCEFVYSDSPLTLMGARNSSLPYDDQVSIHQVSDLSWYDHIWRYGGTPPTPGGGLPPWLLKRAIEMQRGDLH